MAEHTTRPGFILMNRAGLEHALQNSRVIVCAGTGGVGKTTIAAALSIEAARRGRQTLVLTIDPAKRLADALGESRLGATPNEVDLSAILSELDALSGGTLDAVMLDPKPTFDRLIARLAADPGVRERILENGIYRNLSEALAGSAEYAAMEQVHEYVESGRYDLVVVDTPPSNHALDFLTAPRRLREFLDGRFVHALVRPSISAGRFGFRIFGRPLQMMFGLLEKIAGVGFLDDLAEFLTAIDGLTDGFIDRATRVENLLLGDDTRFLLVCGPSSAEEVGTFEFLEELETLRVQLAAIIVNRVRPWPLDVPATTWLAKTSKDTTGADVKQLEHALRESGESEARHVAKQVLHVFREAATARATADQTVEALSVRAARQAVRCHSVPELPDDIDRLQGLAAIGSALFEDVSSPLARDSK
jgi:anion-transporting  ArsA/GET3 family ATPase